MVRPMNTGFAERIYALVCCALLLVAPMQARAESSLGIAAVVNGDAISQYDVEKRLRFVVATTKLTNNKEVLARVRPQVLNAIINEKLQLQEAARQNIIISNEEVEKAIAGIEKDRGMPAGGITSMLEKNAVPRDTFVHQVRSQLAWGRLLSKTVRPRLKISNEEIALAQKNYVAPVAVQELQIGIFLMPVDKRSKAEEVKNFADKVVSENRRGASFEELARQFAGGSSRIDKFWVRPENLDPVVAKSLASAREGMVVGPLRNQDGYTLIKVYEVRARETAEKTSDPNVKIKEILFKVQGQQTPLQNEALATISEELMKNPGACEDKSLPAGIDAKDFDAQVEFIEGALSSLTPAVRALAQTMRVGAMSEPFTSPDGLRLYMLCERTTPKSETIARDEIYPILMQQKVELEAQKYMRNLRRDAFIDIR